MSAYLFYGGGIMLFSKKYIRVAALSFSALLLVFGFQNCNKVQPGIVSSNLDGNNIGLNDEIGLQPGAVPTDEAAVDMNTQVVSSNQPLDTETIPQETTVVVSTTTQPVDSSLAPVVNTATAPMTGTPSGVTPPTNNPVVTAPEPVKEVITVSEPENDEDQSVISEEDKKAAIAWCETQQKSKSIIELKHESITNLINGSHILKCQDSRRVKQILRMNGSQIICDMDIDHIGRSNGRVILVNSEVEKWDDHRGDLVLINSRIKNLARAEGKLKRCTK